MKITFLGTGTSQGVPVIACHCAICKSPNPKDKRLRTSILIQTDKTTIAIDSGPDFRQQMLRSQVEKLDAIIYTHGHKDHVAGLDDVRAYNHLQNNAMNIYADLQTQNNIKKEFSYIFENQHYPGVPKVNIHTIKPNMKFQINEIEFETIDVLHYKLPVLGFRFNDFTYITDANYISEKELQKISHSKYLVLNALRHEPHISHFSLSEAIEIANKVQAKQTYFTHISHQLGLHDEVEKNLPKNMKLAYDLLSLEI
ncbi:MAG: MBL fold metallo-hydrolase [Chitinophagaceae bacterium]|nr:MBL fold metallo-hydrolase [Chitinophagaceae bacterium]HMN33548.1 MBL fold metallo-hydrolase [Chitinophagaceae bacterium]